MRRMNAGREESSFPAVTGASSLLVIFSVLCLTVFSLLSLSTVSADHKIAEENIKAIEGYYQADAEANRILSQIREGKAPSGVTNTEGGVYEYSCRVSDTQILCVTAEVNGTDCRILRWQTVTDYDWEPDTDIPVWNGD